jgi:hypothetical protein
VLAALHPRSFPYHLAPIALAAALLLGLQLQRLAPKAVVGLALALPLASGAAYWLGWGGALTAVPRVTSTPLASTIATLEAVHASARAGERVFDPSGAIYFLPPCGPEWYVDVLFANWVEQGRWMYAPVAPPCTWSLRTHRLSLVPKAHLAGLGGFRLQPGTGGVLLDQGAEQRLESLGLGDRTGSTW